MKNTHIRTIGKYHLKADKIPFMSNTTMTLLLQLPVNSLCKNKQGYLWRTAGFGVVTGCQILQRQIVARQQMSQ